MFRSLLVVAFAFSAAVYENEAAAQQPVPSGSAAAAQPPLPPPPPAKPPTAGTLRLADPSGLPPAAPSYDAGTSRTSRSGTSSGPAVADPTMPSPALRDLIEQGSGNRTPGVAPPQPQGVPEISIRARVFARDKPAVAVLEVGGRPLTVRKDSEIHIPGTADQPTGLQLKVIELSPTELRLEVLKRNQIISLN
jgi:hypothetical protein